MLDRVKVMRVFDVAGRAGLVEAAGEIAKIRETVAEIAVFRTIKDAQS